MGTEFAMLSRTQKLALIRFKATCKNPDNWKDELRRCWMTGNYPYALRDPDDMATLQKLRNLLGPSKLEAIEISQRETR